MANVNFFSPDGGTTRYPLEDTEGRTTYEEEIHGVNLLTLEACFSDVAGVTSTINSDNSVTINGTATNTKNVYFSIRFAKGATTLDVGRYILSVGASIPSTCRLHVSYSAIDGSNVGVAWGDYGANTITFDAPIKDRPWNVLMEVGNGTNFNNLKLYPMLRKADITDPTYRPYNPQAIQNQLNAQGVLGAKNLLENIATTQTIDGVTFTVNADGSVTANGTATNNAIFTLHTYSLSEFNEINARTLVLNGCPTGGGLNTYRLDVINGIDPTKNLEDRGSGITVPANWFSEGIIAVRVRIGNGTTVNNLTFYPMLRLASDPDDTYVPYAMTNKELTDAVTAKELKSTDDLNNLINEGAYKWGSSYPVNAPENTTFANMEVKSLTDIIVIQKIYRNGVIYTRTYNGTWGSWTKFTGTVVS